MGSPQPAGGPHIGARAPFREETEYDSCSTSIPISVRATTSSISNLLPSPTPARQPSSLIQSYMEKRTHRATSDSQCGNDSLLPGRERAEVGGGETGAGCCAYANEERVDEANGEAAVACVEDGCGYEGDKGTAS